MSPTTTTVEKDHGRIETRRCWVISTPEFLNTWTPTIPGRTPGLVMVEAKRQMQDHTSLETRYFISSLSPSQTASGRYTRTLGD